MKQKGALFLQRETIQTMINVPMNKTQTEFAERASSH